MRRTVAKRAQKVSMENSKQGQGYRYRYGRAHAYAYEKVVFYSLHETRQENHVVATQPVSLVSRRIPPRKVPGLYD